MCSKHEALYKFFAGFGIPAYSAGAVPSEPAFPYLTYSAATGDFMGGETSIEVNLWYYTASEAHPDMKADEIGQAIGYGGKILPFDGGAIWLKRGSPWCQAVPTDGTNNMVKRRYINVDAEFFTAQ